MITINQGQLHHQHNALLPAVPIIFLPDFDGFYVNPHFIQTTANRIMEIVPSGQLIDKITTYDEYLASDEMARKRQGFAEAASDDED